MLNAFEGRLIELLADAFAGPPPTGEPRVRVRPRAGGAEPQGTDVALTIALGNASPWTDFGDDAEVARRVNNVWLLRPEVPLTGEISITLEALTGDPVERRTRLMQALDGLLIVLDTEALRRGRAFDPPVDQGFAISAFRLQRLETDIADTPDPTRLRLVYGYEGRFWQVRPDVAGGAITHLPTRMAILPLSIPEHTVVRAGTGPAALPVRGDLRAMDGATPVLLARLRGLGPGTLTGSGAAAPEGFVASQARPDGLFPLSYAPPAAVASPVRVDIELSLGSPEGTSVVLDELSVQVVPA